MKIGQRLQGKEPLAIDERVCRLIYVTQFEVCRRIGHTFLHFTLVSLSLCLSYPNERKRWLSEALNVVLGGSIPRRFENLEVHY